MDREKTSNLGYPPQNGSIWTTFGGRSGGPLRHNKLESGHLGVPKVDQIDLFWGDFI